MKRGAFDRLITIRRGTSTKDDYGGEDYDWADLQKAWARVRFGTAQEKREAAQEAGSQSATFEVLPTSVLLGAQLTDRIQFDGYEWDITEVSPLDRQTLRFTAYRGAPIVIEAGDLGAFDFSDAVNSGLLALLLEDA